MEYATTYKMAAQKKKDLKKRRIGAVQVENTSFKFFKYTTIQNTTGVMRDLKNVHSRMSILY